MDVLLGAVSVLCWLLAIAVFQQWRKVYANSRQASQWTRVPATVIRSEAKRVLGWHETDTEPVYLWEWSVAYRYSWEGTDRISERFSFNDPFRASSQSGLAGFLGRYPVGASVFAAVNPQRSDHAVLTQHVSPRLLFLVLILTVAGLVVALLPTWLER